MYHFFVPDAGEGPFISITGRDVNHIKNVLRMKAGDTVVISNGADRDFYCRICELAEDRVLTEVLPEEVEDAELPARLILFQGVPKGDKLEQIIQKSVELGVFRIVPVAMRRSVAKLDEKKQRSRIPRWNSISESAAKQSGRRIVPEVTSVREWKQALAEAGECDMILAAYENARGMRQTMELLGQLKPGMTAGIFIGPEGGFDPEEIDSLEKNGACVISLGRRILRTETAGPAALTLCMAALEAGWEKE